MPDLIMSGFSSQGFMPHGHCFLWPLIPRAIKLPSTRQLEEIVAQLKQEIKQREVSEAELARAGEPLRYASDATGLAGG